MTDLERFEEVAREMIHVARPMAKAHFRSQLTVERKSDQSPVTLADRAIETAMTDVLSRHLPDHGYFGEEHGASRLDQRFVWVIDPIDGTKSFVSGVPLFGTLIALLDRGKPVLGVIDMPILEETWIARDDGEATQNDQPCRTSPNTRLDRAILFATSPDQFSPEEKPVLDALSEPCLARRFGGDCYSYGLLASGYIDLILEAELQPYDYLPLVAIIQSAGGVITDWDGKPLGLQSCGQVLAAATPDLHAAALRCISSKVRNLPPNPTKARIE